MTQRFRVWLFALAALMTVALAGVGALQYQQWQRVEATITESKAAAEWDIFQFQAEQLRLASKLDQVLLHGGSTADMEQLVLRYFVYLSRYDIMRDGSSSKIIFNDVEHRKSFDAITVFVDKAKTYFVDEEQIPPFDARALGALRQALEETVGQRCRRWCWQSMSSTTSQRPASCV